jgi:hypothetical protein
MQRAGQERVGQTGEQPAGGEGEEDADDPRP